MALNPGDTSWPAMARLVRRTGFGATGAEIDAAVKLGATAYVDAILRAEPSVDPGVKATPPPVFAMIPAVGKSATTAQRKAANQQRSDQLQHLTGWWVQRMAAAQTPWPEKLTFCWHNHFATSATKVRSATLLQIQNTTLRRYRQGDFRSMAQAMLVDPAMLEWLDGQKNTVRGANENLAREFMELFTLGEGSGYTENDVKDGARALTGWRYTTGGTARLMPKLHDQTVKTVLGVTGNLDQVGYGDAVLAQAACPRHVATRMYGQLVSDTAPAAATVARLVAAYGPRRDVSALLRAMLLDPSFGAASNSIVVSPVEWVVGAHRALKIKFDSDAAVKRALGYLRQLGQLPLYPPNVSGWPYGQAWLSTAAADIRVSAASTMAKAADVSGLESTAAAGRIEAVGHLLGIAQWSARSAAALQPVVSRPADLVAIALNTPEYLVH